MVVVMVCVRARVYVMVVRLGVMVVCLGVMVVCLGVMVRSRVGIMIR